MKYRSNREKFDQINQDRSALRNVAAPKQAASGLPLPVGIGSAAPECRVKSRDCCLLSLTQRPGPRVVIKRKGQGNA